MNVLLMNSTSQGEARLDEKAGDERPEVEVEPGGLRRDLARQRGEHEPPEDERECEDDAVAADHGMDRLAGDFPLAEIEEQFELLVKALRADAGAKPPPPEPKL